MVPRKSTRRSPTDIPKKPISDDEFARTLGKLTKPYLSKYAKAVHVDQIENNNKAENQMPICYKYKNASLEKKADMWEVLIGNKNRQEAEKKKKGTGKRKAKGKRIVTEDLTLNSSVARPKVPDILMKKMLEQVLFTVKQNFEGILHDVANQLCQIKYDELLENR